MNNKDPYQVVKHIYTTEKAVMLQGLKDATNNACVARCESPKFVFVVDKKANKHEIAAALEEIYKERKIKVKSVNTLTVKPKERKVRGRSGMKAGFKKAVVTLEKGDSLENL